ncbi:dipeptidyl peptidase 3 isoform X1 [Parasteatoda tepidariorum]|uniref:dipeptidyl peptidase 3 isoform X1 n=1 Tax=Parasteatoda tepidariorum TaxID=114398 RepID=UPI001C71A505|nr:dipeptidyl peptidase 3 [Parasteatoda tepidariorum]XP_015918045.2 dipeptidyl peptidase 3 [Parasteatoda tepidariorum]XP_015918046.2 dipeptidyl peptidase 3 [Parasteatoda tepidariorum]XP_015918047.2 dipeptidyl peptidase 3 [Parasteatoda tepidariorum]
MRTLFSCKQIRRYIRFFPYLSNSLPNKRIVVSSFHSSVYYHCNLTLLKPKKIMSDFIHPNNTPVVLLSCEEAFKELADNEKLYAHYLSRASWFGGLIVLFQTSLESPLVFTLLFKLFREQPLEDIKQLALTKCGFTEDEYMALLVYTSALFSNMGNYKGCGDTKFIPDLPKEKFEKLVLLSKFGSNHQEEATRLMKLCLESMYSLKDNERRLGFPYEATTTYMSKNFLKEDEKIVKDFFKKQGMDAYNSRLFKIVDESGTITYEIRLASVLSTEDDEEKNVVKSVALNGHKFLITRGDYSKLLSLVNKNLECAKKFASNELEVKMIEKYIYSFQTGSLNAHKDGSRFWIKNKGPIVESYIGFIESYRDPSGIRGEFEGFVAMVDKPLSKKFSTLVAAAEEFIHLLPWPSTFEKDTFLKPDFTSLEVLTYSGSNIPYGICIPNYEEIRQTEGFKNVSLNNTINVKTTEKPNFLSPNDQDLLLQLKNSAFTVIVALHELLGHGSGKVFHRNKDGSFNFDVDQVINFETNQKITKWYEDGENFESVFGGFHSSYEECRADSVALYLCMVPEILKIFNYEGPEADDITYTIWLMMAWMGLEGLQTYDPPSKTWLQAHRQARYVMLQVMLEAGEDFVKIEKVKGSDGNPDLLLTLDASKIKTVGKAALGNFLRRLQLYKATADIESARKMYDGYSLVSSEAAHPFLDYRNIVMARKKPRIMFVQVNTFEEDGKVVLKNYDSTVEGMIKSWIDRFPDSSICDILEELWKKDSAYFV